jgi:hypothetical protein
MTPAGELWRLIQDVSVSVVFSRMLYIYLHDTMPDTTVHMLYNLNRRS